MVLQTIQRILILLIFLGGAQITSAEALTPSPSTIELKEPVHFLTPDGSDVLVQSGPYRVESADNALQFISEEGRVLLIAAEEAIHEENVNAPVAVSLAGEENEFKDLHLVMLLLPGGQSLEAAGSYSGVRERGILRTKITNFKRNAQRRIVQATTQATTQVQPDHMVRRVTPLHFVGLWFNDPTIPQVKKVQPSSGKWYWPGSYDLYPGLVHLTWEPRELTSSELPKVISQQGYGFELRLNGKLLHQGADASSGDFYAYQLKTDAPLLYSCPQGKTCLGTTILKSAWRSVTAPWTVELSYWEKATISESGGKQSPNKIKAKGVIYPNRTTGKSYFEHRLYPIFQHDRCKSCHALGSKDALVKRHHGLLSADIIQEGQGLLGMNLGCGGGCHVFVASQPVRGVAFHDSEWKTPRFDMGIDWRGKSAVYICQKVTSGLTTSKMLRDHFFHDARIAWAVHSGELPPMVGGRLSKAPPGDYYRFKKLINSWIRAGVPCPK